MKRFRLLAAVGALTVALAGAAFGAGMFSTLPIIGSGSFTTGTATVPAGPPSFTGLEVVPADTNVAGGGGFATAMVSMRALGQGLRSDVTSPGTATIPANTVFYFLDGAQASAYTVTMPAAPTDGDIQRVYCTAATVGVLTVAANTGQTLKNNPNAACVAGVGYGWVYNAANTTWFRFQ